jgi:beta-lactam-binding protein with PASTA domain
MPDLIGMTRVEAYEALKEPLKEIGTEYVGEKEIFEPKSQRGIVTDQVPSPGTELTPDTEVEITVGGPSG